MIIKRWDATLNAGAGGFVKEFPQTKAQLIRNDADSANIFDTNDKILPAYLPNSVFDSLLFYGTVAGNASNSTLHSIFADIISGAAALGRSPIGYYFVISTAGTLTDLTAVNAATSTYITTIANHIEGGTATGSTGLLEVGDWVVVTGYSGLGTSGSPYVLRLSPVNNTYELMTGANGTTAGSPGLVPAPASNQNLHFLRGDGTWVIPTNTTYSGSTSISLNGTSFERAALTGDVTASVNSNATTIANDAVTFAKMQNINSATILGRNDAGAGDIEALTAAEVRTLINVADGATANTGTVTSVATSGTVSGITLTGGTITTSGTITLGGTLAVLPSNFASQSANTVLIAPNGAAGVPTFRTLLAADIPTLNQNTTGTAANVTGTVAVANGGTGQTSYTDGQLLIGNSTGNTLSKATLTAGTSITITNGSGAITIANAAPNATHTGDVTGSGALTIASKAVTYAKIQDISATNRILGRITAGAGVTEELTAANVRSIIELAAPIYIQTATPTPTVSNSLWYDIN